MTVSARAYNAVMNASATSASAITVGVPTDVAEGDLMIAITSQATGTPTGTGPDNWELIGSYTSSTLHQSNLYRRFASASEPADYTWTFTQSSTCGVSIVSFTGARDILSFDARVQTATSQPLARSQDAARDAIGYWFCAWRDGADSLLTPSYGSLNFNVSSSDTGSSIYRGIAAVNYGPVGDIVNIGDSLPGVYFTPSSGDLDHTIMWAVLVDSYAPDDETWSNTDGDFAVELNLDTVTTDSDGSVDSRFRGDVTGLVTGFSESGENAPDEITENLADGLRTTKWLTMADSGWVQYDFGADGAQTVKRYRLTAANDEIDRDPFSWTLKGSNNGTDFTDLDTRTGESFGNRGEQQEFRVTSPGEYRYYRLDIATNRGPSSVSALQLAEWRMSVHDVWEDVTERVRWDDKIRITRGFQGAAGRHDFSRAYFTLKNPDGLFTINNTASPFYGSLQRNTQVRVSKAYGDQRLQLQGAVRLEGTNMCGDGVRCVLRDTLQIAGDIDVRIDLRPESWRDEQMLCGVQTTTNDPNGNTHASWSLYLDDDGRLNWVHSPVGGGTVSYRSTRAVPNASRQAIRVTVDVDNGASGSTATFYTADSISGQWTQLGEPVTESGTTSIGYQGGALCVGHVGSKDERGIHGDVFAFELRDGIGGTLVSDIDFTQPPVDTFDRTASDGWGTASSGLPWTVSGGSTSDYSVSGGVGRITHTTAGVRRIATLTPTAADVDMYATFVMPSLPVGDNGYVILAARYTDVNNQYFVRMRSGSTGSTSLSLRKRVSGTESELTAVSPFTLAAGTRYRIRFEVSGTTLRAKAWKESDGEPAAWQVTTTDSDLSSAGGVGLWSITGGSITTPFTVHFDDFRVSPELEGVQQGSATHSFAENGNHWVTVNNAVVSNRHYRFHGEVSEWPLYWDTTGSDVNVSVTAAGVQKRLERGSTELSAMYRHHTKGVISDPGAFERFAQPAAYWPCEDLKDTVRISSAVPNAPHMEVYGAPEFEGFSDFPGSNPLPLLKNAQLGGRIGPVEETGWTEVHWVMYVPETIATGAEILSVYTTGSMKLWKVVYVSANTWRIDRYDEAGVESGSATGNSGDITVDPTVGRALYCRMYLTESSTGLTYGLDVYDQFGALIGTDIAFTASNTFNRVSRVNVNTGSAKMDEVAVGHIAVYGSADTPPQTSPLGAHRREAAGARLARLAAEEDVEYRYVGASAQSALMGAQDTAAPFPLMSTNAVSDEGFLMDPLDAFGLEYRTGRSLYNQAPHLTLSYTGNYLSGELTPSPDDSHVVNDFTASRGEAGSARFRRDDGPLSVSNPPDGVGEYAGSQSYSFAHEGQCVQMASWQVHKGTLDEARYPRIQIALENPRVAADSGLIEAILTMDVGRRVDITDLPDFLPAQDIRQIVIGYEEWFDNFQHDFTLNTLPERVYEIAEYDAGDNVDTYDTVLYGDHSAAATELTVLTSTGPGFTADPQAYPFDIRVDGETMRVLAAGGTVGENPLFTTSVDGWAGASATVEWSQDFVFPNDPTSVAAMKITPNGGVSAVSGRQDADGAAPASAQRDYIVSGWFYSPNGTSDVRPQAQWVNNASAIFAADGDQHSLEAGVWTFLENTVTAPDTTVACRVAARLGGTPSATDYLYVWNLKLTEVTPMYGDDTADSFNRADSTTSLGSTDQGDSRAWTQHAGTWGISSNTAYISAAGTSVATVTGAADFEEVSVEVPTWPSAGAWVVFRATDASNHVRWGGTVGSDAALEFVVAGVTTRTVTPDSLGTDWVLAAGDRLSARCNGSVVEVFLNGDLVATVSETDNQSMTRVGMRTTGTGVRFDDFRFIESGATQYLQVERGVNADATPHKAASGVSLHRPPYRGL